MNIVGGKKTNPSVWFDNPEFPLLALLANLPHLGFYSILLDLVLSKLAVYSLHEEGDADGLEGCNLVK